MRMPVTAIKPISVCVVAACSSPRSPRAARITRSMSAGREIESRRTHLRLDSARRS
jgi:hypothetical protein